MNVNKESYKNVMRIGCAILAGGKSSRMGTDKALLEYEGKSFVEKLCDELNSFEEKIVARGNRSDIEGVYWSIIPDIYTERGPIGGLHAVLSTCNSEAMFCVSCDTPFLELHLARKLCEHIRDGVDAVIAVTADGRKHPLCGVYCKTMLPVIEEQILAGNHRLMASLDKVRVEYVSLSPQDSLQLKNINTPEEYLAIK